MMLKYFKSLGHISRRKRLNLVKTRLGSNVMDNSLVLGHNRKRHMTTATSPRATSTLLRRIENDALKKPIALTFKDMYNYSEMMHQTKSPQEQQKLLMKSAQFLRDQVPIRLAHVILALQNLPYGVNQAPSIQQIYDLYLQSYEVCINLPEIMSSPEQEKEFTEFILTRLKEHLLVK
ncbi:mitochondrial pyruvate dehydrogenase kinase [Reticulomyxa filosa]|uniref:Protein-serine/threonine kinase n=1 Tax=Reticulomyxa filosa TaxID=46433 RepID=X6MG60_RETFI|nr:mitochondrial pyruvate dehydrogenase kinase [Reticulomyxa filosa]|eukprot:ETO13008.1 mitochondrial pyruvate dehydrogenase kinase [Reticulomyxa filosa]